MFIALDKGARQRKDFSDRFYKFLLRLHPPIDYGLDNLVAVTKQTKFPWLMSNVLDIETSRQLAEGKIVHIIEKNGIKVIEQARL